MCIHYTKLYKRNRGIEKRVVLTTFESSKAVSEKDTVEKEDEGKDKMLVKGGERISSLLAAILFVSNVTERDWNYQM